MSRSRAKGGSGRGDGDGGGNSKGRSGGNANAKRLPRDKAPDMREKPLACLRSAEVVYDLYEYTTRLGRGRSSDIVLTTSKSISSKHAIISIGQDGRSALLKDLNSLNGTFINNVRVHNGTHKLESRDLVKFGCDIVSYRFEFASDMQEFSPKRKKSKENRRSREHNGNGAEGGGRPQTAKQDGRRELFRDDASEASSEHSIGGRRGRRRATEKAMPSYMGSPNRRGGAQGAMTSPYANGGTAEDIEERRLLARERAMALAREQGERVGKWSAEFDDMKRRLKDVENREDLTRSFRAQARERLRNQRRQQRSGEGVGSAGEGGGDDEEGGGGRRAWGANDSKDPDADMLIYDSAEGFIKQSQSSPKQGRRRSPDKSRSPARDKHAPSVPLEGEETRDKDRAHQERDRWDDDRRRGSRSSSRRSLHGSGVEGGRDGAMEDEEIDGRLSRRSKQSRRSLSSSRNRGREDDGGAQRGSRRSLHQSGDSLSGEELDGRTGGGRRNAPQRSMALADSLDDSMYKDLVEEKDHDHDQPRRAKFKGSETSPLPPTNRAGGENGAMGGAEVPPRPRRGKSAGDAPSEDDGEGPDAEALFGMGTMGGDESLPPMEDEERPKSSAPEAKPFNRGKTPNTEKGDEDPGLGGNGGEEEEDGDDPFGAMRQAGADQGMRPSSSEDEGEDNSFGMFGGGPDEAAAPSDNAGAAVDGKRPRKKKREKKGKSKLKVQYEAAVTELKTLKAEHKKALGDTVTRYEEELKIQREALENPESAAVLQKLMEAKSEKDRQLKEIATLKEQHETDLKAVREECGKEMEELRMATTGGSGGEPLGDKTRVVELLGQVSKLRLELVGAKQELQASKHDSAGARANDELLVRARCLAIRPIVKEWRRVKLSSMFGRWNEVTRDEREYEAHVGKKKDTRSSAARQMYKTLARLLHARTARAVEKWKGVALLAKCHREKQHAVREALAMSEDKAKARGLEAYCRELQIRLEDATDVNRQQSETLEELEELDWPRKLLEQKTTIEQLYTQLNEVREQAEMERESFAKALREIKTAGPKGAKAQIQNFITAQSRQVMLAKQQIQEYERRHEAAEKAWVELEQEKESLSSDIEYLRRESLEQAVSWRDMLGARDKRLVYLEDKLASLAGYGDAAKKAAAQVLVRELHDMRRETADFAEKMQRRVDRAKASSPEESRGAQKGVRFGDGGGGGRNSKARDSVMESRVVQLQNELRQLMEEGSVAHVVKSQEAARMARVDAASHMAKCKELSEEIKALRKEMCRMVDPTVAARMAEENAVAMDDEEDGEFGEAMMD